MDITYRRFVVGTRERPTVFLTESGEVSEDAEDGQLFDTIESAHSAIQCCDEPELFTQYGVVVRIQGV